VVRATLRNNVSQGDEDSTLTRLLLGLTGGLAGVDLGSEMARGERALEVGPVTRIATDPLAPHRVYATTRGEGFFRSTDSGRSWERRGEGIDRDQMTHVAVSRSDRADGLGVVYVGTELTAIYRSTDGGETFVELTGLQAVPSRPTWSFPPRPDTNHFQSFAADTRDPDLLFVGIEVGGVMRSSNRGETWEDHNREVDGDPHTLLTHPDAPGRIYVGGGAGYCQSLDSGRTWTREYEDFPDDVRYFYAMAVDPGDPEQVLLIGAPDHISGHGLMADVEPWSTVYRRSAGGRWQESAAGLPPAAGTEMGWLAADGETPGLFFYSTVDGDLHRSTDGGEHWTRLEVDWTEPPGPRSVLALAAITD
jgi:photosystem II stability/assembly factor-like uncharacterized protein